MGVVEEEEEEAMAGAGREGGKEGGLAVLVGLCGGRGGEVGMYQKSEESNVDTHSRCRGGAAHSTYIKRRSVGVLLWA